MAKIDLKDAYFAVPVSEKDRRYLRFRWGSRMFQFNCLPFGLSCAPWVFTNVTKAAVSVLREMGIRLIIYIDYILVMAESETLLRDHVAGIIYLTWDCDKFPKVTSGANKDHKFSQVPTAQITRDKIKSLGQGARKVLVTDQINSGPVQVAGQDEHGNEGGSNVPSLLSAPASGASNGAEQIPYLSSQAREELQW